MSSTTRSFIRAKVRQPAPRAEDPSRPRVQRLLSEAVAEHRIVLVTATAGSGKTSAAADLTAADDRPTAWLTLDRADTATGRLVSYLEEAVRQAIPEVEAVATKALAQGVGHPEAAALLAEAIGERPLVVVIDELERVSESELALDAIASFLTYLQESVRTIILSRRDVPLDVARIELTGQLGRIGEHDLALTIDEARVMLDELGRIDVDPAEVVESTAGWLTGVLFESWRSSRHVRGTGGEADPLSSYLSSEIMATLPDWVQGFLVHTSVLDEVTASRAEALGLNDSATALDILRGRHLPVDVPEPHVLRYHPRFREFLLDRLDTLEPAIVRAVHARHADLLTSEGRDEEAVDEYLRAGDIAQAEDIAAEVILSVVRRLDIELARRWMSSFRRWRIESSAVFTQAELLAALEVEAYGDGAQCADRLLAMTDASAGEIVDPSLPSAMAWCYFLVGRLDDAHRLLDTALPGPQTDAMRFAIGVELLDSPVHYRDRPADSDTEVDGMLARIDLAHGRFERILATPATRYDAVRSAQLGALTSLGRLEEATERLGRDSRGPGWTNVRMSAELLAECDRPEDAWSVLIRGRDLLAATGSSLYRMFASLTEAMLALRFSKDTALASAILDAAEREPTAMQRVRVVEQVHMWRGLIALLEGDHSEAIARLTQAVDLMTKWDRLLFLPTAAVYLAEASWLGRDDEGSDAAADLALTTAERTGSRHTLIRALREFPDVLSRRLDLEADPDSPWHDLGRAVLGMADPPAVRSDTAVLVQEFGEPALVVDGRRHRLKLGKSAELLSYLAWRGGAASRDDVVSNLFDSRNDRAAHAYLRMAVNGARSCLPDGGSIELDGQAVTWVYGSIESEFTRLRARLVRLRNVQGRQRLSLAMAALTDIPEGEYLGGSRSPWAADQRRRWQELVIDIRHAAAEAAFDVSDLALCLLLIDGVLAEDPYRERAWRLKMRVAGAVGDGDGVIAAYRSCCDALGEMSITPSGSTRQLLDRLRT